MNFKNFIPITTYRSDKKRSKVAAQEYCKTFDSSYRYLAYRDIHYLIKKYVLGKDVLDYGCGTGISTQFLINQKFIVTGVDTSEEMLKHARLYCPLASFYQINDTLFLNNHKVYDFIFSGFVLLELGTEDDILRYLTEARKRMKKEGIFIAVTGSQHMYLKNWFCFNNKYRENQNLKSGDKAKIFVPEVNIEFTDYYWTEVDYRYFFEKSGLILLDIYYPLGNVNDPFLWKDENIYSPFLILTAKPKA
ncbi:MAG: class I SAM-dependent methyltransferase [Gammaproteobacteria bacterium]|jgi:SAM-dependent methyltransferase